MINKIGNKIANKATKVSWNLPHNNSEVVESDTEIPKDFWFSTLKNKSYCPLLGSDIRSLDWNSNVLATTPLWSVLPC